MDNQSYFCSGRKDLELERKQASFDPRELNYYIHGGKEVVEVRLTRQTAFSSSF